MIGGDGGIILKYILKIQNVRVGTGFSWLRIEYPVAGSCEYGNEHLISISVRDCLD